MGEKMTAPLTQQTFLGYAMANLQALIIAGAHNDVPVGQLAGAAVEYTKAVYEAEKSSREERSR